MASGREISSNGGQGRAEQQHQPDIIPEEEEFISDLSSESDMEVDIPRLGRRRITVLDVQTRARRQIARAEIDRNLALLRSVLPQRTTGTTPSNVRMGDEDPVRPVGDPGQEVANNMPIIPQLLRNLQGTLSVAHGPRTAVSEGPSRENPIVEVLRDPLRANGNLNLKISSANRAGLLEDVLACLQLSGFNLLDGSNVMNLENAFYANFRLEKMHVETPVGALSEPRPEPRLEPQPELLPESEEDEALVQAVIRLIHQDAPANAN